MLEEFDREIWIAEGRDEAVVFGFRYPTRMAVIRLSDKDLFIWSPTSLTTELRLKVEALGRVQHLVAPNSLHHLFLPQWKQAYPEARIHAPPGLRKKRADIAFDADLDDAPQPDWADKIDQVLVRGNLITSEVVFFHRPSRTALFTDLLQQFPADWFSGWRGTVAKLDLMVGTEPAVPRKFRAAFADRRAARRSLKRILEWPVEKVLMAHGKPVERDGIKFLHGAFEWLGV